MPRFLSKYYLLILFIFVKNARQTRTNRKNFTVKKMETVLRWPQDYDLIDKYKDMKE